MDRTVLERQMSDALHAHEGWKSKLAEAARSGVLPKPAREISCDDQCAFGKWLHGMKHDPAVTAHSGFGAVMQAHAAFHKAAGQVAALVEQGRAADASAQLNGPAFQQATGTLKTEMLLWRQQVDRA